MKAICNKCNGNGMVKEHNSPEKHECEFCNGTGYFDIVNEIATQLCYSGHLDSRITFDEVKIIINRFIN